MNCFIAIIGFIEAIYIIYILRYFKTTVSFEYGRSLDTLYQLTELFGFKKDYIKHNTLSSEIPVRHVCRFGRDVSFFIAAFYIIRSLIFLTNNTNMWWSWNLNIFIDIIILLGSFANFNVVVYLLPIFIIEIFILVYFKFRINNKINKNDKNKLDTKMEEKFKNLNNKLKIKRLNKRNKRMKKKKLNKYIKNKI